MVGDFPVKTIIVEEEEKRFDGQVMADVAIAINGEIVNECGAF